MTGFKSDADPTIFSNAKIAGTYILDPWYPDISSIWGPSDPPGTFQNNSEMIRNFLPWKRPEGTTRRATACTSRSSRRSGRPAGLTPMRRTRGARKTASRMSLAITPAA
jgi:hypothetical protein